RNPLLAFIEIIILWCAILYTIIVFYKINKNTLYLLIPYILWVSFAAVLNFYLFILN
ncbi:tryptophan-rich sensory protein, partial [Candidatus Woesearchaeota archaeon]|nr:tryptophan-rich sensory protein [Candidatus Woesearchaeota archaeon]